MGISSKDKHCRWDASVAVPNKILLHMRIVTLSTFPSIHVTCLLPAFGGSIRPWFYLIPVFSRFHSRPGFSCLVQVPFQVLLQSCPGSIPGQVSVVLSRFHSRFCSSPYSIVATPSCHTLVPLLVFCGLHCQALMWECIYCR